ncbi:MAG: hypothetical protein WCK29_00720 [archaeon]
MLKYNPRTGRFEEQILPNYLNHLNIEPEHPISPADKDRTGENQDEKMERLRWLTGPLLPFPPRFP